MRGEKKMAYKNPEVSVDECNKFKLNCIFTFEQTMIRKEAAEGITKVLLKAIEENGGVVPLDWLEYTN